MFEEDAKASGMTLKVVESSAILRCDPIPILRILSNFVSNAVRYAPGARVLIGARRRGAAVLLEVHDTGPGMEHATLQRVIERAVQGDAPDKAGFGVGLSIVGKMAEDHGLDWQLESVPGRGTIARLSVASGEEAERVRMVG
jgi:signal transduction histidine kinase